MLAFYPTMKLFPSEWPYAIDKTSSGELCFCQRYNHHICYHWKQYWPSLLLEEKDPELVESHTGGASVMENRSVHGPHITRMHPLWKHLGAWAWAPKFPVDSKKSALFTTSKFHAHVCVPNSFYYIYFSYIKDFDISFCICIFPAVVSRVLWALDAVNH